jgi:hypothetical protein
MQLDVVEVKFSPLKAGFDFCYAFLAICWNFGYWKLFSRRLAYLVLLEGDSPEGWLKERLENG